MAIRESKYKMTVIANRYASDAMKEIWSLKNKYTLERKVWLKVLRIQKQLGIHVPQGALESYESCLENIDLESIDSRELVTGHDVKARIEEYNSLAGYECIHLGMTSRDLTETVELIQIQRSLELVIRKAKTLLWVLGQSASKFAASPIVARTHNVPAQLTTLGKKFATWAEELMISIENSENLLARLPARGIRGATGTNLDLIQLLDSNIDEFETRLVKELDLEILLHAPTQIYPRSIDFEVVATIFQLAAAPSNLALNIRLMSGHGFVSEGLAKGKTGSSAMPHKVNPRLSERINSLTSILRGHVAMVASISGDQWNEGDVSCSALRRVALPDSFAAIDGILDTAIYLVENLSINQSLIEKEITDLLPEIASSTILMLAVKSGAGRESAHQRIKELAREAREDSTKDFLDLIIGDPELCVGSAQIKGIFENVISLAGKAPQQAEKVAELIRSKLKEEVEITTYRPGNIR
jgi:adenylosuccinate lyase